MTTARTLGIVRSAAAFRAVALVMGLAAAIVLRVVVGGVAVRDSVPAGLLFAAALAGLTLASGCTVRFDVRAVVLGVIAGALLCLPVALRADVATHRPSGGYLGWAAVVGCVAMAEEAFLRGALFDAVEEWAGPVAAVAVGAVCFAGLHVPLYGWASAPLDLAVGLLFGALRWVSGSWLAPGLAHTFADLVGWWLR